MSDRSKDWLAQAEKDLEQAKSSQAGGRHEWACFAAQQSAEKAVKALHLFKGQLEDEIKGVKIPYLKPELLIKTKMGVRPKHVQDRDYLERLTKGKK